MNHKGLTKTFTMISNWKWKNPLVSMVYTKIFQRFKGLYFCSLIVYMMLKRGIYEEN